MQEIIVTSMKIDPSQEGSYLFLPFEVPDGIQRMRIKYDYGRYANDQLFLPNGTFVDKSEISIIDLGLIAPDGQQVGASGSDKMDILISENFATPGYRPTRIQPGIWQILVGAYKVDPEGMQVFYEITLDSNGRQLFRGDLHTHTLASDGVHTLEELAFKAKRNGLDFLAVTDHNQFVSGDVLARIGDVTMIPGVEWTHYRGHANLLGLSQPFDGSFAANTVEEIEGIFSTAHQRGATIVLNHPFDETCGFQLDWKGITFDCIEVWNGPMRESNLKAVGAWQQMLVSGKKVAICGGSDYHRDTPFIFLGGPTMGLYAESLGSYDLLNALRGGHGFITFAPNGPVLEMTAGDAILGETVDFAKMQNLEIGLDGLLAGDVVRLGKKEGYELLLQAPKNGKAQLSHRMDSPGFARVEVLRAFLPGLPMLPALISNPIYFDA